MVNPENTQFLSERPQPEYKMYSNKVLFKLTSIL